MSTTPDFVERRRAPRVPIGDHTLSIVNTSRVRILDISLGGVLMACGSPGGIGARATLTLGLAAEPFVCEIEVRQQQVVPAARQANVGAGFVEMSRPCRHSLEQFLMKATQ